ncbi:hypothetical protein BDN72DRAFT_957805 [Pluteus cervinus]|uniref:Uncharacterized protein n=1 Tax=Pluteus cervinus TaxID=181527 RepID=A0ACD3B0J4_9AGAR|nr:hypothetical protein BDN72DRAFT_957805 [Pluteus cervinus]
MEDSAEAHPLKSLLQSQLATDSSAVTHLPFVLSSLTPAAFAPSSHLTKWTTRIGSLLHAKDSGSCWAGLCLANQTSIFSRNIMMENAQSWLAVALPMLSKGEPLPTLKACMRLSSTIFSSATDMTEFQRQVSTPNVPKFTAALLVQAEKQSNVEVMAYILTTLRQMVMLYPTLHRASQQALASLSFRFLNGGAPTPILSSLKHAGSALYVSLHLTGGRVGAATQWRKSLDETLALAWTSFHSLRSTFPIEGTNVQRPGPSTIEEQLQSTPLHLDRLRSCIVVLCDLLTTSTYRAVQVPLGALVKFAITLVACNAEHKVEGWVDPVVRALEVSVVPDLWELGCDFITILAERMQVLLNPDLPRLAACLAVKLERQLTAPQRLCHLSALNNILDKCHLLASHLLLARILRALLPSLVQILGAAKGIHVAGEVKASTSSSKKGKKRARNFEGDEILREPMEFLFPSPEDRKATLITVKVVAQVVSNPYLSSTMHSLASRLILASVLILSKMTIPSLSPDPLFQKELLSSITSLSIHLASGTTNVMSQSLPLVINAALESEGPSTTFDELDLLLHPRVPPLMRSVPFLETLALFPTEEPQEEIDARVALGVASAEDPVATPSEALQKSTPPPPQLLPAGNPSSSSKPAAPASKIYAPPSNNALSQDTVKPPIVPPTPASTSINPKNAEAGPSAVVHSTKKTEPVASSNQQPAPSTMASTRMLVDEEEEEDEMPTIDMNSDSD